MTLSASPTTAALVALMKLKGVGRRVALKIIDQELDKASALDELLAKADLAKLSQPDVLEAWKRTEDELERSLAAGIRAYSVHEVGYPERLKNIADPPAVLYVKGEVRGLHVDHSLAVVGTREPTSYGQKVARKSSAIAVEADFVIVSGLAHGCDTFGHHGCIDARGVGIVALAHGLDRIYPAANRGLAEHLLELGGCLVSEYPLSVTPIRSAFAERDRIQSGLSDGVLVIETDVRGGTMHTVRFSREQKRALACIEHPETLRTEEKTRGNQKLIADRWADAIPDGGALRKFLERLKSEYAKSDRTPFAAGPGSQISLTL